MRKRVALILLMNSWSGFYGHHRRFAIVVQVLRLINEHVKWQSDKEISSG
jgi:hypothetical protein